MSTTIEGIDARGYLKGWLQGLENMYSADVNAIPEDKWTATFGGCTRSASALTADAISLLVWTAKAMNGNPPSGDYSEFMTRLDQECSTREGAIARLKSAIADFNSALTSAGDDTLNKTVTPPWHMDAPLFMVAQVAVSHVWYHDGQLNYIHCLLGDDKIHWMG